MGSRAIGTLVVQLPLRRVKASPQRVDLGAVKPVDATPERSVAASVLLVQSILPSIAALFQLSKQGLAKATETYQNEDLNVKIGSGGEFLAYTVQGVVYCFDYLYFNGQRDDHGGCARLTVVRRRSRLFLIWSSGKPSYEMLY